MSKYKVLNGRVYQHTALIIPISACGASTQNMHYFAKPQNWWGLKFLTSDTNLWIHAHLPYIFRKNSAWSKELV